MRITHEEVKATKRKVRAEVRSVSDVSAMHHGWLLKVHEPVDPSLPVARPHTTFVLGKGFGCGVRQWTPQNGVAMVGLCDDQIAPGVVGTERAWPADTRCELLRPVSEHARRALRARANTARK